MRELLPSLFALLPFLLFAGLCWLDSKRRERIFKFPLTTRLLRPPGESLRIRIDTLGDKLTNCLLIAFYGCAVTGVGMWMANENLVAGGIFIVLGLGVFCAFAISVWKIGEDIRDCRLGFVGERAVGEELNQLLASGWKVFHDVEFHDNPGQKPFNVDHVVVGTGGVFAIETKTRRKRANRKPDDPKNEVIFNGGSLVYPWGEERFGIDQARQRAAYLNTWLKTQLGTEISVQPVLALPGWSVHRRAKSDLRVVSGREIANIFRDEDKKQRLEPQTVKSITALLDQKCRDVE
jgi:hypothetical protein